MDSSEHPWFFIGWMIRPQNTTEISSENYFDNGRISKKLLVNSLKCRRNFCENLFQSIALLISFPVIELTDNYFYERIFWHAIFHFKGQIHAKLTNHWRSPNFHIFMLKFLNSNYLHLTNFVISTHIHLNTAYNSGFKSELFELLILTVCFNFYAELRRRHLRFKFSETMSHLGVIQTC